MIPKIYDPLSDMSRIKDSLASLFCDTEDITNLVMPSLDDSDFTFEENWYGGKVEQTIDGQTKLENLIGHCFTVPYIEGTVTDNRCAIFIETYLASVPSKRMKNVVVEISIIAHKDSVGISKKDKKYYNSIGVYGNRVDCLCQLINSCLLSEQEMQHIKEKYSIGEITLFEKNPIRLYVPGTKFYGKIMSYVYTSYYQRASR